MAIAERSARQAFAVPPAEPTVRPLDRTLVSLKVPAVQPENDRDECDGPAAPQATSVAQAMAERLQWLREQGAAEFDRVGLEHVERLAGRARQLGEGVPAASTRLWNRAWAFLQVFEVRYAQARGRAQGTAERLQRVSVLRKDDATQALQQGRFTRLAQLGRRYPQTQPRSREQQQAEWHARLVAKAIARGLRAPAGVGTQAPEPDTASSVALAVGLYRERAGAMLAARTVARALRDLPEEAGRYHAASVATRTLESLQQAPAYLQAQLDRLAGIALVASWFEPPEPEGKPRSDRGRTRKVQGRAGGTSRAGGKARAGGERSKPTRGSGTSKTKPAAKKPKKSL